MKIVSLFLIANLRDKGKDMSFYSILYVIMASAQDISYLTDTTKSTSPVRISGITVHSYTCV